ncbi:MAG: site-specific integrase [Acidobacteria bacterium]|nr:site-specific integrase [Acidobacteriota bacterium]MCI0717589.1 site-specific integrase [Acidobacteriota bacterium]
MARRGDGLILRGKTWWLDFTHMGERHQVRLGRNINRTVAGELATVERGKILRCEAGIGGKKRKDMTFEKASEEFLKWAEANKRPGTAEFYRYCLQSLARTFAGKKLSEIHPFLIEKHKQMRIAEGYRVAVNRDLACLSSLFNRCKEWRKYEGENPAHSVKKLDEPLNRVRYLTEQEEAALLKECSEPLRTIVLLGIYAGLRINAEALSLTKGNVDLSRRLLTIEAAYSKNGETQTIPIHSKLLRPLKERMQESRSEHVFERKDGKQIAFEQSDGKRIRSVRTAFTNACERANLAGVSPHTLRHTFASRLGMAGVNNITLQKLGRWKEPEMILRYAHFSQEHLADAIEKIGMNSPTVFTTKKVHSL